MGDHMATLLGPVAAKVQSVTTLLIPAPGVTTDRMLRDANPDGIEDLVRNDDGTVTLNVFTNKLRSARCDVCGGSIDNIPPEGVIETRHGYVSVAVGRELLIHECPLLIGGSSDA